MNPNSANPAIDKRSLLEQGLGAYQEVWSIVRRHNGRIVFLLIFGVLLASAYCAVDGPWYDSTEQLLVIKKRLDTTPLTGPDQVRGEDNYLSTHMLLITSRKVVAKAIAKGDLRALEQYKGRHGFRAKTTDWVTTWLNLPRHESNSDERLVTEIINALVVTRDTPKPGVTSSNEVLNLSFRGNVSGDSPKILNAIVASYQEFLKDTYRNTNLETLDLINQARVKGQQDLEAKEAAYQKFVAETPPLWKTQDRSTTHQDMLLKIDTQLASLRLRRTEIEAALAILDRSTESGRNPTATVLRLIDRPTAQAAGPNNLTNPDPLTPKQRTGISLEEEFVSLQIQYARLVAIHPKEHNEVLAVARQLEALRRMIVPAAITSEDQSRSVPRDDDIGSIKAELLRQELEDIALREQALSRLFQKEQQGVSGAYIHEIQDEAHRKGIERDRMLYESILHRLNETSSVKDFGGYNTQVIGPALEGELALKKYVLVIGMGCFAGLFLGCFWAYLAEIAAKRTRSQWQDS